MAYRIAHSVSSHGSFGKPYASSWMSMLTGSPSRGWRGSRPIIGVRPTKPIVRPLSALQLVR